MPQNFVLSKVWYEKMLFEIRIPRCTVLPIALAAGLMLLTGCASVQVHVGMKVYLEKIPVTSMKVEVSGTPGIAPGEKLPLVATFTQPDGKILQTEGAGQGKVMWKDLQVTATIVTVNQKGVLTLPRDPRISDGKVPHV